MSYINEALKKAQRERDANSMPYMQSFHMPGSRSRKFYKKTLYYIFLFSSCMILLYFSRSWFYGFFDNNRAHTQEKIKSAEINTRSPENRDLIEKNKVTDVDHVKKEELTTDKNNQNEILLGKAASLIKKGRTQEAKQIYRKMLDLNPGNINALNNLGVLILHEGKYKIAEGYFEKAVRLAPNNVNPYYNLACTHALSGNKEKAMKYLLKAVSLDNDVREWIRHDTDLAALKGLPEFNAIMK